MDGNGRWAERRGLPRTAGHRAGVTVARRIVETAPGLSIGTLTLFAFSSDNWKRPLPEVAALMQLFRRFLRDETSRCVEHGVAVNVVGRRDRLPAGLLRAIDAAEAATAGGTELTLRVAVDYSGRDAIRRAALATAATGADDCSIESFGRLVGMVDRSRGEVPPLDVMIRTGGEQRLSDFLLWEAAYAELFFHRELWPDFRPGDLAAIMAEFRGRNRRFGALAESQMQGEAPPARGPVATVFEADRSPPGVQPIAPRRTVTASPASSTRPADRRTPTVPPRLEAW
jgi:undecaprenyl diphosphate synthase